MQRRNIVVICCFLLRLGYISPMIITVAGKKSRISTGAQYIMAREIPCGIPAQEDKKMTGQRNARKAKQEPERMLNAGDLAEYLKVAEQTIYRWCRSRKIPHFNLNNTYRFDPAEIQQWLKSKHLRPEGSEPEGDEGEHQESNTQTEEEISA
jgi:excisionase family DNA binding protein